MRMIARRLIALAAGLGLACGPRSARAESLTDAWTLALGGNQRLQAEQAQSVAQGYYLRAARSARLPTVRSFNFESFLTATPGIRNTFTGTSTGAGVAGTSSGLGGTAATLGGTGAGAAAGAGAGGLGGLPAVVPILGQGQRQLPVSVSFASLPLYSGGRIHANIAAANQNVSAQRAGEFKTALDLKLTVAEAYVSVLRAQKGLDVARTNVSRLASFARDARNRATQGLATRSDVLAADVTLANARLGLIQSKTTLESSWATYNRYLERPMSTVVALDELPPLPSGPEPTDPAAVDVASEAPFSPTDEGQVQALTEHALRSRPELAGLLAQAQSLNAQAASALGSVRPQVAFTMSYLFLGNNNAEPQGIGAASLIADWTLTDGGQSRRRSAALKHEELAARKRRNDAAADVALEVRTRWLELRQSRDRLPVARLAIAQADENVNVVTDRYRQQLSNYTEVLDAENRRVQSLNNYYNALYDEHLALFRLQRAVGDL